MTVEQKLRYIQGRIKSSTVNVYAELNISGIISIRNVKQTASNMTQDSHVAYGILKYIHHISLKGEVRNCQLLYNTLRDIESTLGRINRLGVLIKENTWSTYNTSLQDAFELLLKADKEIIYLIEILTEKDLIHTKYYNDYDYKLIYGRGE